MLDWFYTLPREDFPIESLLASTEDLATFREALKGAARGGHLELVKHLREKGCEWDESTCAAAARKGTCMFWSICEQTAVHGTVTRVRMLPQEINWIR